MRVMVTGATGFVGYHTTCALLDAGHEVSVLVRSVDKLLSLYGEETPLSWVRGDIGDRAAIRRALAGCDAVVHSAATVSTSPREAERVFSTNVEGARNVLGEALDAGVTQAIHVSSVTALYNPDLASLDHTTEPGCGTATPSAYGRSKIACEQYARGLQAAGAPLHITYPASVIGPEDPGLTEPHVGFRYLMSGVVPAINSGNQYIDVRDLALAHVRIIDRQPAAGRFPMGGTFLSWPDHATLLAGLTGRRFITPPMPAAIPRMAGRCLDRLSRVIPLDTPFSAEGMQYATHWVPLDDSHSREVLAITPRPLADSVREALLSLHRAGHLADWQMGTLK